MEGLLFILIIVLLALIIRLLNKVRQLDHKLESFIRWNKAAKKTVSEKKTEPTPEKVKEPETGRETFEKSYLVETEVIEEKKEAPIIAKVEEKEKTKTLSKPVKPPVPPKPPTPPKPSFWERNPDLEKFIGENLLSKIGIVIFVIGMGFLVKLGIDKEVITESMRVGIGVLIGGAMIALAHRLRNTFRNFSSVLIGGALAVLYFTIAMAFHEYELIPQTAAFVIMVIITAFGVLLSIRYDRIELAVLAMLGGFGTPFFLSTGSGNITVLFTYMLILNIGMLTLVYFKKWNIINYLAYGFTYIIYTSVFYTKYLGNEDENRFILFGFLTAFYVVFFIMSIIYNVKNKHKFKASEIGMLLSNSAIYFGFGLSISNGYNEGANNGLFTILMALFNFGFTMALFRRKEIDRNLLFLLVGLVLTFISLVAPIQLEGNYITLFWALEMVLLVWLSKKSALEEMKAASMLIGVLMLISLAMDWQQNYFPSGEYIVLKVLLNKVFVTSLVSLAAIVAVSLQVKEDVSIELKGFFIQWRTVYAKVILGLVLYFSLLFEMNYQYERFEFVDSLRFIHLGIYNYLFVFSLILLAKWKGWKSLFNISAILSVPIIMSYLTFFQGQISKARELSINNLENVSTGFPWHYLLLLLFILIIYYLVKEVYLRFTFRSSEGKITMWLLAIIGVIVCSSEGMHIAVMIQKSASDISTYAAEKNAVKSVFPAIWALSALALMIVGMKYRLKTLRIASLALFSLTIFKLFVFDLAGNSTGKIVSFVLLGAILLLISFLYQKLKFIIEDDDEEHN